MSYQTYAIGAPGQPPMFVSGTAADAQAHTQPGWVCLPVAYRVTSNCVINAAGTALVITGPTFAQNQSDMIATVKRLMVKAMGLGVKTAKGMIDSHGEARASLALHYIGAPALPITWSINWTMADNSVVAHTKADFLAALNMVTSYHAACHDRATTLKTAIRAATTQVQLDAIDITALWPEADLSTPKS